MSNTNGNKHTRTSKFEVLKNKRKSLIPLPLSTNAKSPSPEFHVKLRPPHQSPPRLTAKSSCVLRHKLRSIHSSTIPPNDNDAEEIYANHPCSSAEGCYLVSSKVSLMETEPPSKHRLTWNNDDTISIKIEANETNSCCSPSWSLIACEAVEPEVQSQLQSPEHLQTSYALAILADKACRMAFRTRGYFLCPICNEPFSRPAIIACGHLHCMRCVSNWFQDQDSCPCCRYRIVVKEVNNALLAKDFFEANTLLASIFTAGNFHDCIIKHAPEKTPIETSNPTYESPLTNFVAAKFRQIFQQESTTLPFGDISKSSGSKIREGNCFLAALWFSRQVLLLINSPSSEPTFLTNGPSVEKLRELLTLEVIHGNDRSRESFLKKVMTTSRSNCEGYLKGNSQFTIPNSCLKHSSKKSLVNGTTGLPRFRFRSPSMQTFWKIILTGIIFVAIALAVRICDLRSRHFKIQNNEKSPNFYGLDFFVFTVSVFSMAAYTESERLTFWRRRGRGRGMGNYRDRQRYPAFR